MRAILECGSLRLIFLILSTFLLVGCDQVSLKTLELQPTDVVARSSGSKGSKGVCLVEADPPFSTFSAGSGQGLVGFDNFYKHGSGPLPCDDFRTQVFGSAVVFDFNDFDDIVSADLLFDTQNSVQRSNGETLGSSPPRSFGTDLGMATSHEHSIEFDNGVPLSFGPSFSIGVSDQVRKWIDKSHSNLGFSINGPGGSGGPIDPNHVPQNNDAKLSWYGNFRLRVVYNPKLNPNAPQ